MKKWTKTYERRRAWIAGFKAGYKSAVNDAMSDPSSRVLTAGELKQTIREVEEYLLKTYPSGLPVSSRPKKPILRRVK